MKVSGGRLLIMGLFIYLVMSWLSPVSAAERPGAGRFLLVWAGDADRQQEDFMAVIDVRADLPTFGHVLKAVPVGSRANELHPLDLTLRGEGAVWASGLLTGRTFIFDVSHPPDIKLLRVDEPSTERAHTPPHSSGVLPNGHTLATAMDMRVHAMLGGATKATAHGFDLAPGGLLEFDAKGKFLREISVGDPKANENSISPYGLDIKADLDLVLTTNIGHGWLPTSRHMRVARVCRSGV